MKSMLKDGCVGPEPDQNMNKSDPPPPKKKNPKRDKTQKHTDTRRRTETPSFRPSDPGLFLNHVHGE